MTVTMEQKKAFVKNMADAMKTFKLTPTAQILVISHAAYESGWGTTKQAKEACNIFNVSRGSWKGKTMAGGDTEYKRDAGGKLVLGADGRPIVTKINQAWRFYSTLAEAVADYFKLLSYARYRPAYAALKGGDSTRFIELLGPDRAHENPPIGGYYTQETQVYLRNFSAVASEVSAILTGSV